MSVELERTYLLPTGKTLEGIKDAIKAFFDGKINTSVSVIPSGAGSYLIKAETKLKSLAVGTEFDVTVSLTQRGNNVDVYYREGTNNLIKTLKGIFFSAAAIGICELYGVASRRDIPLKINERVQSYFNET